MLLDYAKQVCSFVPQMLPLYSSRIQLRRFLSRDVRLFNAASFSICGAGMKLDQTAQRILLFGSFAGRGTAVAAPQAALAGGKLVDVAVACGLPGAAAELVLANALKVKIARNG